MSRWRAFAIPAGLVLGCLAVLALPAYLLWNALRPVPWNAQTLKVQFESVRYQSAGLVFSYTIENRTGHFVRLLPEQTSIRVLHRPEVPDPGYPSVSLPLDLDKDVTNRVELRLDIPTPGASAGPAMIQEFLVSDQLDKVDGFELKDRNTGALIVFPRRW